MSQKKSPEYVAAMRELDNVVAQKGTQLDENGPDVTSQERSEFLAREEEAYRRMARALGFSGLRVGEDLEEEAVSAA